MKKELLFTAVMALSAMAASAQDNYLVFGYCKGYDSSLGQSGNLQAAIEIPAAKAAEWVGDRLTQVRIGFGTANRKEVTVFISGSLKGEPIYSQTATLESLDGWNTVTLDTPFEITGQGFFVGYKYANCRNGEYPIGIDGVPTTSTLGDNIAIGNNWEHVGSMYGNMCIQAVITGDNLPKNNVEFTDLSVPPFIKPGEPFQATARVVNQGSNKVTEIGVEALIDGVRIENLTVEMQPAELLPGENATLTIGGLYSSKEGLNMPLSLSVTTVNGTEDSNPADNSATASVASFYSGYHRNVVVEEWTGTWCGFCPRGIVGMSYMRDTYGDDGFIGIAVHGNNGLSKDPMTVSSYSTFLNKFALIGFPGSVINRMISTDPNKDDLEKYYKDIVKHDTYARVSEVGADYDSENPDKLKASASVEFTLSVENADYSLAFVITEDHVGPYQQSNFFAGGSYGPMDGWEKKSANQFWYYDEVARNITSAFGIKGSIPTVIEAGKAYSYEVTMPLEDVEVLAQCWLTALLLDNKTGEIVNAAHISLYETGIASPTADGDEPVATEYFTLDGRKVTNPERGIYVEKTTYASGSVKARKIARN